MKWEYAFAILLHGVENLLMTTPVIYAFTKAQERNAILEDTIGPVPQETESLERLRMLAITAPVCAVILVPIQALLIYLYNHFGHPWNNFFKEFNAEDRYSDDFGVVYICDDCDNVLDASLNICTYCDPFNSYPLFNVFE